MGIEIRASLRAGFFMPTQVGFDPIRGISTTPKGLAEEKVGRLPQMATHVYMAIGLEGDALFF